MSTFKPQQRHLTVRGRAYHFVSYEAQPADSRRNLEASPAMWFLMVEGHRCPVLPCDSGQSLPELDAALERWIEHNAVGPVEQAAHQRPPAMHLRRTL